MRPSLSSYLRATSLVLCPLARSSATLWSRRGRVLSQAAKSRRTRRDVGRRRVPVLHDNLQPAFFPVPPVEAFEYHVLQPLAVGRRNILDVQFPADLAAVANLTGGVLRQWCRIRLFDFSPLVEPQIGDHSITDAFLYGFGTGFGIKVAKCHLELAADGWQHREETRVPCGHPLLFHCRDHVNLLCCDRAVVLTPRQYLKGR